MSTTTTKRPVPTVEELRNWGALGAHELDARIGEMLDHAGEDEHALDVRSYRQGLEDGICSALATWALDEGDCDAGPPASVVYLLAQELGLDGAQVCQRVADASRLVAEASR